MMDLLESILDSYSFTPRAAMRAIVLSLAALARKKSRELSLNELSEKHRWEILAIALDNAAKEFTK